MPQKPKLLIALSFLIILAGTSSLVAFVTQDYPAIKGTYAPWYSLVISTLYIIAGIGAFLIKRWARWLILIFCAFYMIKTPVNIFLWFNRFGDSATVESKIALVISAAVTFAVYAAIAFYFGLRAKRLFEKNKACSGIMR